MKSFGTHKSSGYCGTGVHSSQKLVQGRYKNVVPVPRVVARAYNTQSSGYGYECRRKDLTEVPGTGMDVVLNSQKSQVRVIPG